ncbi:hypothetical protein F4553_003355 [Allocatelliglobosispora scoriae]|uniref:Uncharacterized protein n=1 Tax=Allocatelliglobosispora scoriae TaxID=643052 RepID=A0A841BRG6_9ACTN|nr:hypothetical protein [Allocatelliglobosispora scoriae]MBB5869976.1 hypothetical protein [Allocatelliglobosispora scoriae]
MRDAVTVEIAVQQLPGGPGRPSTVIGLRSGQSAVLGWCGCGRCQGIHRIPQEHGITVRITAEQDQWRLCNLSTMPIVVEDMEDPDLVITIPADRRLVAVTIELAQVRALHRGFAQPALKIFGPAQRSVDEPTVCAAPTHHSPQLNEDTRYFATLVALCAPRLRESPVATLPTAREIAEMFTAIGQPTTQRAVDSHLDAIRARLKLIGEPREALATEAIRCGIVRRDHLDILPTP